MPIILYHNPRCSKSRAALALLRGRGVEPEIVEYLEEPPDAETLAVLLGKLEMRARDLVRRREPEYAAAGLDETSSESELIAAMAAHPKLIERPIAVAGERAVLGRPPENVLALIERA